MVPEAPTVAEGHVCCPGWGRPTPGQGAAKFLPSLFACQEAEGIFLTRRLRLLLTHRPGGASGPVTNPPWLILGRRRLGLAAAAVPPATLREDRRLMALHSANPGTCRWHAGTGSRSCRSRPRGDPPCDRRTEAPPQHQLRWATGGLSPRRAPLSAPAILCRGICRTNPDRSCPVLWDYGKIAPSVEFLGPEI